MHISSQHAALDPATIVADPSREWWRGDASLSKPDGLGCEPKHVPGREERVASSDASTLARTISVQRIRDTPAWLISLIIHLVLLLSLALITTSSGTLGRMLLTTRQGKDERANELVEFSITPVALDDSPFGDTPMNDTRINGDAEMAVDWSAEFEIQPVDLHAPRQVVSFAGLRNSFDQTELQLLTELPAATSRMFAGRTGAMKKRLLRESGGTDATEDAVKLGLRWLQQNQLKDGSWSLRGPYNAGARSENQLAATAMAMLAFMGAGSTHRGGEYKKELFKAVRWLVKQQDGQGFLAARCSGHEKMYAQAQGMIALCELYAMTGDSWIRPYAQRACDFACRAQSPQGGWRYQPRLDSDTSVTGWFVVGLKSGEAAGLEVVPYVFQRVVGYLDSVSTSRDHYDDPVGYSYAIGHPVTPAMTAEGLLCRQYTGWHRNMPEMRIGLEAIGQNHPIRMRERDVYYWYYATQALHHFGGPMWTRWNDRMKVALPASQEKRGKEKGSWSPEGDAWGRHAGRLYTTCLSLYCLEVYYRHMPIYSPTDMDDA